MKEKKRAKLYAVSNAHLDTQWNWTIKDTIRDCVKNTMDHNFALFEKYPSYKINFEGAFRYKLMKEYYPEDYERVKDYVKKGNWVPVGSTWDAMDVNVPSAEALMRQVLYGNNYFEEELGVLSKDIFLPDCFGFRAALPSIAAHMGLIGFSTQKLVWGVGAPLVKEDSTTLPPQLKSDLPRLDLGRWRGPDGNEVFVSLLSGNYTYNFDKDGDRRPIKEREELLKMLEHNEKISGVAARNLYFGTGDYGGSCSEGSAKLLEEAVGAQGEGAFDVLSATPTQIYEELTKEEQDALPVYEGGLLIPHGYGAMTSHTAMKRLNRQNEQAADACERVCAFAELLAGVPYPKKRITEAWKHFLWHQFHDDLTGTSIADAYLYSHNDQVLANNIFRKEGLHSIARLSSLLNCKGMQRPLVLYNPSAFERTEEVRILVDQEDLCLYDHQGNALPCRTESGCDGKVLLYALVTLPALSLSAFDLRAGQSTKKDCALEISENTLENEYLKVLINDQGNICSIFDKRLQKELLSAPIREELYDDHSTTWPSWEYSFEDLQKDPRTEMTVEKIVLLDRRPVSVGIEITKCYQKSRFVNELTLSSASPTLQVRTQSNWQEKNSLLCARFPLSAQNKSALFDGGMGGVSGQNTNSYPYFVHNVHKWADLCDESGAFGITIANDCKYAMTKPDDHTLSLILIHTPKGNFSPRSGQDFQDQGENVYSYSITAHSGTKPALKAAEALNHPIWASEIPVFEGPYTKLSLLTLEEEGIEIRALKKEEKGERFVLRLQECYGKAHESVRISFPCCTLEEAFLADGYERQLKETACEDGALLLHFTPYETKTLLLSFKKGAQTTASCTPVALEYNENLLQERREQKEQQGVYLPAELMPSLICSAGITYQTGAGLAQNVLSCQGQTLTLSGTHRHLRLLCAARKEAKSCVFKTEKDSFPLTILALNDTVGARPMVVNGSGKKDTAEEIAHVFTHTKNADGSDRLYDFAYLFAYDLAIEGAQTLILPNDPDILLFAAGETNLPPAKDVTARFEGAQPSSGIKRQLNVLGCKGSGSYEEGATVLLFAPPVLENGIFESFEGEGILSADQSYALIRIPDHDLTIKANYRILGENVALGKNCVANHFMNRRESPEKATDGKPFTKWCGAQDEQGRCLLEVDLEKEEVLASALICHAGDKESVLWNTVDFEIQVKAEEHADYRTVVSVKDNRENVTIHDLGGVTARFVRLYITKPARDGDLHARIYHLQLYKQN